MKLVTPQTGEEGRIVRRLLIEEGLDIKRELYLSILVDRATGTPVFMASAAGGMEIEEVAKDTSRRASCASHRPATGFAALSRAQNRFRPGPWPPNWSTPPCLFSRSLYRAFLETDASLARNQSLRRSPATAASSPSMPKSISTTTRSIAIPNSRTCAISTKKTPLEVEASKFKLNYIKLDGNIGCMVNGAGLAMATMDIIKLSGGSPANFLDVGGGASEEQVKNAFRILLSDPEREGRVRQYFRRHPALRRARQRRGQRREEWNSKFPSSCAWKAPTWSRARKFCATRA